MKLTDKENEFVEKRAKLVRVWPVVGSVLILIILGLGAWLFFTKPLLANPAVVMERLQGESIEPSTLMLMAAMLPIVVLTCVMLTFSIVFFGFSAVANEKKYITIIKREMEKDNG